MMRRSDPLRFLAVAILVYALAGLAAGIGLHLLLGRQPGELPSWVAGAAGLFVAFVAALPAVFLLGRGGARKSVSRPQKVGDGNDGGAIL